MSLLINTNISNNHATHSLVDALHQLGAHHRKVLSQCRTENLHEQRLVLDELLAGIARNACTDHLFPSVDGASLQQRRLQSFASQIHIKQVAYRLHVTSEHTRLFIEHTRLFISWLVSDNLTALNIKQLIVVANAVENAVEMLAVGVGNEYLSESVARHELHNLLHTM